MTFSASCAAAVDPPAAAAAGGEAAAFSSRAQALSIVMAPAVAPSFTKSRRPTPDFPKAACESLIAVLLILFQSSSLDVHAVHGYVVERRKRLDAFPFRILPRSATGSF